ncbi:hypothetical protein AGMMS4956_02620 [Bacteroidia bacterium]|nr:hypothetical protein AGMMS4956_02620 [Bacteroidia bacterium]
MKIMKRNYKEIIELHTILRILQWLFIAMLVVIIVTFAVQLCNMLCCHNGQTFCALFYSHHFLKILCIAFFSLLTLYVAGSQLKKHTDMACIEALAELRKQLTSDRNRSVHFALLYEEEKDTLSGANIKIDPKHYDLKHPKDIPMVDVYNYLGTIGLGTQMLRRNLIDIETFYYHIGYRVENIFEGESDMHTKIRKHINENKSYYTYLLWLYSQIQEWKIKNHKM